MKGKRRMFTGLLCKSSLNGGGSLNTAALWYNIGRYYTAPREAHGTINSDVISPV